MSFKPEVFVDGTWSQNGLVFETEAEARENASDTMLRWTRVSNSRAVESTEPANYRYTNGKLEQIEPSTSTVGPEFDGHLIILETVDRADLASIVATVMQQKPWRFRMGRLVSTPGAIEILTKHNMFSDGALTDGTLLERHMTGDWGDLDPEDKAVNEEALTTGARLLSAYKLGTNDEIWIITERDAVTTILLPSEY